MGYSKKLQNVLGGYKSIIANAIFFVNTKDSQILQISHFIFVNIAQIMPSQIIPRILPS